MALPLDESVYEGVERIQILACGTSRHAAQVGVYLLEQLAGIPTRVFYASEFRYAPPPLAPHTLAALAMEQERRRAVAEPAFAPRLLGITSRPESSLGRLVDQILDIGAGIEVGVVATKTFLGQLLAFYGLALAFAERHGPWPQQLRSLVDDHDSRCEQLAHLFADTQDVIFLGRGINFPIVLEEALKLKEISSIHAEGSTAGEMKHGPIALLDARVPVVDELISPLLTVIPMQLLSYHIAAHRGLDVDQPRNLAKSVTVE